jgi:hypothetical protein
MWLWLFIGSLLPIWRRAGDDRPLNTWQYIGTSIREPMKHIPTEEAIEQAKDYYNLTRPDNPASGG